MNSKIKKILIAIIIIVVVLFAAKHALFDISGVPDTSNLSG